MKVSRTISGHCANVLKGLCQPSRIQIIGYIRSGEKSVTDIVEATGLEQTNTSHHIAKLCLLGVLDSRKEGQMTLYRLKHRDPVLTLIDTALKRPDLIFPPMKTSGAAKKLEDTLIYKLCGDITRVQIIENLRQGEATAGTLVARLGAANYNISRHIAPLKRAKIVRMRKEAAKCIYSLAEKEYILTLVDLAKRVIIQESRDTFQHFETAA